MSWSLDIAVAADIDELMTWFPDKTSVDIWGGPKFRFPFDRASFHEDCCWKVFSSYCLRDANNHLAAFGQLGARFGRAHLARLVANPTLRGQGVGRRLIEKLIATARVQQNYKEIALFVYRDNKPAYQCYLALGFEVQKFPDGAPMEEKCYYMTRVI
jgi:ribosomal protein S18 acetylase RimI-like enzyme